MIGAFSVSVLFLISYLVYHALVGAVYCRDTAENLTQDCFIRAYKARDQFRGDASRSTWLMRIAVNLIRDHQSSNSLKFWRRVSRTAIDPIDLSEYVPDQQRSPEAVAAAK